MDTAVALEEFTVAFGMVVHHGLRLISINGGIIACRENRLYASGIFM
jgi:hypothetical protein